MADIQFAQLWDGGHRPHAVGGEAVAGVDLEAEPGPVLGRPAQADELPLELRAT